MRKKIPMIQKKAPLDAFGQLGTINAGGIYIMKKSIFAIIGFVSLQVLNGHAVVAGDLTSQTCAEKHNQCRATCEKNATDQAGCKMSCGNALMNCVVSGNTKKTTVVAAPDANHHYQVASDGSKTVVKNDTSYPIDDGDSTDWQSDGSEFDRWAMHANNGKKLTINQYNAIVKEHNARKDEARKQGGAFNYADGECRLIVD